MALICFHYSIILHFNNILLFVGSALDRYLGCFQVLAVENVAAVNIRCVYPCHLLTFLSGLCPGEKSLHHGICVSLALIRVSSFWGPVYRAPQS